MLCLPLQGSLKSAPCLCLASPERGGGPKDRRGYFSLRRPFCRCALWRICGFLQKRLLRSCICRSVACIILYQRRGLSIGVALSSAELQKRPRRPRPCDEPNAVGAKSLPERSVCRRWRFLALRAGNGPLRLRSVACKEGGAGGAALGPRHVIATREG